MVNCTCVFVLRNYNIVVFFTWSKIKKFYSVSIYLSRRRFPNKAKTHLNVKLTIRKRAPVWSYRDFIDVQIVCLNFLRIQLKSVVFLYEKVYMWRRIHGLILKYYNTEDSESYRYFIRFISHSKASIHSLVRLTFRVFYERKINN